MMDFYSLKYTHGFPSVFQREPISMTVFAFPKDETFLKLDSFEKKTYQGN